MANALELSRVRLELSSITYGKHQTQFRIQEYLQQIAALEPTLEAQVVKEAELIKKLADLENESK